MRLPLVDMIPNRAQIDKSDIGYIFYRYMKQVEENTKQDGSVIALIDFRNMINDVLEENGYSQRMVLKDCAR